MNFDIPSLNVQPFLLVDQKLIHILPLITLKLNHLPHLGIIDNIAIARKLLLQRLEDFLRTELLGQTLDSSQSLTVVALLNPDVDEGWSSIVCPVPCVFVGISEWVGCLEIFEEHGLFGFGLSGGLLWLMRLKFAERLWTSNKYWYENRTIYTRLCQYSEQRNCWVII